MLNSRSDQLANQVEKIPFFLILSIFFILENYKHGWLACLHPLARNGLSLESWLACSDLKLILYSKVKDSCK